MMKVDRIKPMLLSEYDEFTNLINKCVSVSVQPKLDGWRSMGDRGNNVLYSRGLNDFRLPHIEKELNKLDVNLIPDGELYCHGLTLPEIQSAIKRGDERIQLHVFDAVSNLPFSVRYERFVRTIRESASIKVVPMFRISPSQIMEYHDRFLAEGYEGIVIRLEVSAYEQGRSESIFRKKPVVMNSLASIFI